MASATKIAALVVAYRVLTTAFPHGQRLWTAAIAALAIISLAWGNIGALVQLNVKRILAYSSVSHAGFMLIGIAAAGALRARAPLYYLIPYPAMSLAPFAGLPPRAPGLRLPVTRPTPAGFRVGG